MWIEWLKETRVKIKVRDYKPYDATFVKGELSNIISYEDCISGNADDRLPNVHYTKITFSDGAVGKYILRECFQEVHCYTVKATHIITIPFTKTVWAPNENQAIQKTEALPSNALSDITESHEVRVTNINENTHRVYV